MTRHPNRPGRDRQSSIDDAALAELIRAATDEWRMPPQRLDQPTWRDRLGTRRRRGPVFRIAIPMLTAVAATVIVAFVAVWLTTPVDRGVGRTAPSVGGTAPGDADGSPSARSTAPLPTGSGLPAIQVNGSLPDPSGVMVQAGSTYRMADLATGVLGESIVGSHRGPTAMLPRASGGWACICGDWSATGQVPDRIDLAFQSIDPAGTTGPPVTLPTIRGSSDPSFAIDRQPALVDVSVTPSADGRYAFVGSAARQGAAGWELGIDVVDLADGRVVSSTRLPVAEPADARGLPTTRVAARVVEAPAGGALLVSSFWYVEDPSQNPPSGTAHWMSSFDGSALGTLVPAGSTSGETCGEGDSGPIDTTMQYILCATPSGSLAVERRAADGTRIDVTTVPGTSSGLQESSLVERVGDRLFIWDPVDRRLARFDLRTAAIDSATGTAAAPIGSPLEAMAAIGRRVGNWLAPATMAKIFLQPALVASPDGSRIYGLGVGAPVVDGSEASSGIYAFDARSLQPLGHWAPTADLDSIAISPDGRFLYAAGQAGVDAAGNQAPSQRASVTVYDTADGTVRLIAGALGSEGLFFPWSTVR
jgi:hypothetical protein